MIAKFQKWVWLGSAALALIAGTINTVGFLSFQHQGVTHLTGSTTLLGIAVATGHVADAWHLGSGCEDLSRASEAFCVVQVAKVRG